MNTSSKDKITCLNSSYALSVIKKKGKKKFPMIPFTVRSTETELISDKHKEYKVNK